MIIFKKIIIIIKNIKFLYLLIFKKFRLKNIMSNAFLLKFKIYNILFIRL